MTLGKLATIGLALACPAAIGSADPLAAIGWLAGCWQVEGREAGNQEAWLPPAGGSLVGVARTVREGRTVAFEHLRIVVEDAEVALHTLPSGQQATRFAATRLDAAHAWFENPAHDFPKRVRYQRQHEDRIVARIDGGEGSRGIDFPMQRIDCGIGR